MPSRRAVRSLPDDELTEIGDRIVAALKAAGGSLKTGALAKAAKEKSGGAFTRLLVKLVEAGRIVRGGNARGAWVALPGKTPGRHL